MGVRVIKKALDADTSGVLISDETGHTIIVNSSDSAYRQRFTIAHEIGHFYMHKTPGVHVDKKAVWAYRNQDSTTGTNPIEVEANQFAAELLMPEDLILSYRLKNKVNAFDDSTIAKLAVRLGVSLSAMTIRLTSLRLLKPSF